MVGDVGMPPQRTPFYEREISLLFARSYGPGRYEPSYEEWGVDYPAGQVRWTEGRNQEAVLDLLAAGRLEVCHFVDLAQALTGADIEDAAGVLGGDAVPGHDGVVAALRFADGSVASVTYGSTPPVAGKERIEILAGSQQVIIDDFRSVQVNGRTRWKGRADKGHRAHAAAFLAAVRGGPPVPTEAMLGAMRATLQAAERARQS